MASNLVYRPAGETNNYIFTQAVNEPADEGNKRINNNRTPGDTLDLAAPSGVDAIQYLYILICSF